MLNLRQMDSIVHNTLLIFKGFEITRREEGTNIFYDVYDNPESGKRFLGIYRVWEWHDGSGRSWWIPLDTNDPEILKLRHGVWEAIMAIALPANQSTENNTAQTFPIDTGEADYSKMPMRQLRELVKGGDEEAKKTIIRVADKILNVFKPDLDEHDKLLNDPYGKIIMPWLEKQIDSDNPLARLSANQHSTNDIWDMVKNYPTEAIRAAQPLRPDGFEVQADNTAGTALYKRDAQGNITDTKITANDGWVFEVGQKSIAIKPESIRLNHTTGGFQPGLYPPQAKDAIIKVTSETLAGLSENADTQAAKVGAVEDEILPNEFMQIEEVAQSPALQDALRLCIHHPQMTYTEIATQTKYKNEHTIATLFNSVRNKFAQIHGRQRQEELFPNRRFNPSRGKKKTR